MNAAQLVNEGLERFGEYPATFFEGKDFTNKEQLEYACRLATVLKDRGVQPGDRVVVMMTTCPDVPAAFQAIWRIGAIIIPIMPQLIPPEVKYIVENSGAEVVVTIPLLAPVVAAATQGIEGFREILVCGESEVPGISNISPEIETAEVYTDVAEKEYKDLAVLVYTSGTTGHPKGVMLTHGALIDNAKCVAGLFNESDRSRSLMVLPMSHVYGILLMNVGALLGFYTAMLSRFDPEEVLQTIQDYKVSRVSLAPTMMVYLVNHPNRDKYDCSSLRFVTAGSAPLSIELQERFAKQFGCRVADGYGQSEATCAVTSYRDDEPIVPGSAGRALPGVEICIMDDDGNILGPNETGEICIKGSIVMLGYWNKPKATAETIIDDWLHSGDIGHLDENGYVFITDRKKDMIVKGGENISPRQIEEAIHKHPNVAECAVFGVPDEKFQEEIAVAVVPKPGKTLTEKEIVEAALKEVTKFKKPAYIDFKQELPKNSNGKVLKRTLREQWVASTE
ncbi:MAG: AMP-binding protein [Planctomycetaceae bacterium]|nr:AMP-binding protein [Planctomycetaceae bacterium]